MKIDFNIESIRKNRIELLDCELDLIMRSLELYCYIYRFAYPRKKKYESKEEELRISLVIDTYNNIMSQYNYNSNFKNLYTESIFEELEKKVA